MGFRIETADRFQAVAEEVEPHRLITRRRKDVEQAATHGKFAAFGDGRDARVALGKKILFKTRDILVLAGLERQDAFAHYRLRRHLLRHGVGRRKHQDRLVGLLCLQSRQTAQGIHALSDDARGRAHPVVRQAIPGRKLQDVEVGREEGQGADDRVHAGEVARHEDAQRLAAGQIGRDHGVETFRAAAEGQGAVGRRNMRKCRHNFL